MIIDGPVDLGKRHADDHPMWISNSPMWILPSKINLSYVALEKGVKMCYAVER
jgi:hypothetical protein